MDAVLLSNGLDWLESPVVKLLARVLPTMMKYIRERNANSPRDASAVLVYILPFDAIIKSNLSHRKNHGRASCDVQAQDGFLEWLKDQSRSRSRQ